MKVINQKNKFMVQYRLCEEYLDNNRDCAPNPALSAHRRGFGGNFPRSMSEGGATYEIAV